MRTVQFVVGFSFKTLRRACAIVTALGYAAVFTLPAGASEPAVVPNPSVVHIATGNQSAAPQVRPTIAPTDLRQRVESELFKKHTTRYEVRPPKLLPSFDWRLASRDPRALRAISQANSFSRPTTSRNALRTSGARTARFGVVPKVVAATSPAITGKVPWETYQSVGLPGVGAAAVNAFNGNLLVQSNDMHVAHKGMSFDFTRTYNSLSGHDLAGSDGSQPSVFGNGWTNTYDAHIALNSAGGISVFTASGARNDYSPTTSPSFPTGWQPAPGVFAQLSSNSDASYDLTQTDGSVQRFYPPSGSGCPAPSLCGRLFYVIGRNHYTSMLITYIFNTSDDKLSTLSQIQVTAEDGEVATLDFEATSHGPLAVDLVWPAGQKTVYGYDSSGNLNEVDQVQTNAGVVLQGYGYSGGKLSYVTSPRYSNNATMSACADGQYQQFNYDASGRIASIEGFGVTNFAPNDGTATYLRPGAATGCNQFLQDNWAYSAQTTTYSDSNGHSESIAFDPTGRLTVDHPLGPVSNATVTASWSSSNELLSEKDIDGYNWSFAYDDKGNRVAVSQPSTATSQGTVNPTFLFGFDSNSNLLTVCDPVWTAAHSESWTGTGTPAKCTVQTGVPHTTWTPQTYEPYGELTGTYTARGYHRAVSYNSYSQSGSDYGMPTDVVGDSITEVDSSVISPTESFKYDSHGNETAYNFGLGAWYFTYDASNRVLTSRDPDGFLGYTNWYANGQMSSKLTSLQQSLETKNGNTGAVRFAYDPDGNQTTVTHHYGGVAANTNFWYDGADRLVESAQPKDPSDEVQTAFLTRFLYDNTQGGTVSISSPTGDTRAYHAHGNLYDTQFYMPPSLFPSTGGWRDFQATAFDAADRVTASYSFEPSAATSRPWRSASVSYGTTANTVGQVVATTDETGATTSYAYDPLGNPAAITYSTGSTPSLSYTNDADGRAINVVQGDIGDQSFSYDADGNVATETEAPGVTSSATYTYKTYLDGVPQGLSVSSKALNVNDLLQYVHRVDGQRTKELVHYAAGGRSLQTFNWAFSPAGRITGWSDDERKSSVSYDVNGLPSQEVLPASTLGFSFDPEGNLLNTGTLGVSVNDRGEAISTFGSSGGQNFVSNDHPFAGMLFPDSKNTLDTTTSISFDPFNSAKLSDVVHNSTEFPSLATVNSNWAYDAAGRVTTKTQSISNNPNLGPANLVNYAYDATDHLRKTSCNLDAKLCPHGSVSYYWNADGEVIRAEGDQSWSAADYKGGTEALHWANGQLLFTTNAKGALDDLKIGTNADITTRKTDGSASTNITYWDRDISGEQVSWHGGGVIGPLSNPGDPVKGYVGLPTTQPGILYYISQARTDGYSDGLRVFQGERVADGRLRHWATRDTDPGSPFEPLSIKPYVYNGNNSQSNSDPSGNYFSPFAAVPTGGSGGSLFVTGGALTPLGGLGLVLDIIGAFELFQGLFGGLFGGGHHGPSARPPSPNQSGSSAPGASANYGASDSNLEAEAAAESEAIDAAEQLGGLRAGFPNTIGSNRARIDRIMSRALSGKYPTKSGSSGGSTAGKRFPQAKQNGNGKCSACGQSNGRTQTDHVIARSRGGNTTDANTDSLCGPCNRDKGALTPQEWINKLLGN